MYISLRVTLPYLNHLDKADLFIRHFYYNDICKLQHLERGRFAIRKIIFHSIYVISSFPLYALQLYQEITDNIRS